MGGRGGSALPGEWPTPDCNTSTYSNGLMGPNIRQAAKEWSTPKASDAEKGGPNMSGSKGDMPLPAMAAHWPTPRAEERQQHNSADAGMALSAAVSSWPTPTTRDNKGGGIAVTRPDGKSRMDMLDWKAESFSPPGLPISGGPTSFSSSPGSHRPWPLVASASGGTRPDLSTRKRLNPVFVEWLMGWPLFWTNTEPSASSAEATALWRSALQQRLSRLCGE